MKHVAAFLLCWQLLSACASGQAPPATAESLAKILLGYDEHERVAATLALGKLGKAAVPALAPLLAHEDETARYYALWALSAIGPDAAATLPRLLELASDPDDDVRDKAVYALGKVGKGSKEVFAFLAKRCRDKSPPRNLTQLDSQRTPFESLAEFGLDAVPVLLELAADRGKAEHFAEAVDKLLKPYDGAPNKMPHELRLLLFDLWYHIEIVLRNDTAFDRLERYTDEYLAFLRPHLQKDGHRMHLAAGDLGQFAKEHEKRGGDAKVQDAAFAMLAPLAKHRDAAVRLRFVESVPASHPEARKLLRQAVYDDDYMVRRSAVSRYGSREMFDELGKELANKSGTEQFPAARILRESFSDDKATLALVKLLGHKEEQARFLAAFSLSSGGFQPMPSKGEFSRLYVPILLQGLKHPDAQIRNHSASGLIAHAKSDEVAQALRGALGELDPNVWSSALIALSIYLGPDEEKAVAAVVPFLASKIKWIRAEALGCLSRSKHGAVSLAEALASSDDPTERISIGGMLARMEKNGAAAVPVLRKLLDDPVRWRVASLTLLGIDRDAQWIHVLEAVEKRDPVAAKQFAFAAKTRADPSRLIAALLEQIRDPAQHASAAKGLALMSQLLPEVASAQVVAKSSYLKRALIASQLAMRMSDTADRRAEIVFVAQLRQLAGAILSHPYLGADLRQQCYEVFGRLDKQVAEILMMARSDSDLQVRRLARRAQMYEFTPFLVEP